MVIPVAPCNPVTVPASCFPDTTKKQSASTKRSAPRMKAAHQILGCFGPTDYIPDRFRLLGRQHRRTGENSVVQFSKRKDGPNTSLYALKFFARRSSYVEEVAIFRQAPPHLQRFMPAVKKYEANLDGAVKDAFGHPVPPFIVVEKAVSLSDRAHRMPVDLYTLAQVVGHVSQRIAELHEAGHVHRDLKPGNIIWQASTRSWLLINFGISSPAGGQVPVAFTPSYAAPETLLAHLRGDRMVTADAAVDAWALGVIAFELLLQRPAFGFLADMDKACKDVMDPYAKLPWDHGDITQEEKRKFGDLRGPMLMLLQHDPATRASARQFIEDVRRIFSE